MRTDVRATGEVDNKEWQGKYENEGTKCEAPDAAFTEIGHLTLARTQERQLIAHSAILLSPFHSFSLSRHFFIFLILIPSLHLILITLILFHMSQELELTRTQKTALTCARNLAKEKEEAEALVAATEAQGALQCDVSWLILTLVAGKRQKRPPHLKTSRGCRCKARTPQRCLRITRTMQVRVSCTCTKY